MIKKIVLVLILILSEQISYAEDGYRLWLRFDEIEDLEIKESYRSQLTSLFIAGNSEILNTVENELKTNITSLFGQKIQINETFTSKPGIVVGRIGEFDFIDANTSKEDKKQLKAEGFLIKTVGNKIVLTSIDDKGLLYGAFHLLQHLNLHKPIKNLHIIRNPAIKIRVLNHWDNLDRTVERGYAGFSIWNWHELPNVIEQRYIDYARANASIGINGTVLTNVNANALVFRADYLQKAKALADVFRPYGIKVYLTARFSAPIELGGLPTADPKNGDVQNWWNAKSKEIYELIPDFGGFLVKANSEGQPGPQEYNCNHADGANMLADAVESFGGVVMWRAFVYSNEEPDDRAKQAYNEFIPLDGKFRKNVLLQVKNGPIDFQPREPVHPLFTGMKKTPLMLELQITKEYLGQGTHMVGLANMYQEILQTDTYAKGKGLTLAQVIDGSLYHHDYTGIAGVANIGTSRNWTGNLFGQADWYAFGRLAWNPNESAKSIFTDWSKLSFTHNPESVNAIVNMLDQSYETCVKYMTPLGLHHIMGAGHHYGPGPWVNHMPRADWNSTYYHKADEKGLGFNRSSSGSDALSQYPKRFREQFENVETCPEPFLLWFHHVPWDFKMTSGLTLWDELCLEYDKGVRATGQQVAEWQKLEDTVDKERFRQVLQHLKIQTEEAAWWRDACLRYFQSFSDMDFPSEVEKPKYSLEYYQSLAFPYAPGIKPQW